MGFSGTIGIFNNDSCHDAVFTMPFHSAKQDQGAALVYMCDFVCS